MLLDVFQLFPIKFQIIANCINLFFNKSLWAFRFIEKKASTIFFYFFLCYQGPREQSFSSHQLQKKKYSLWCQTCLFTACHAIKHTYIWITRFTTNFRLLFLFLSWQFIYIVECRKWRFSFSTANFFFFENKRKERMVNEI